MRITRTMTLNANRVRAALALPLLGAVFSIPAAWSAVADTAPPESTPAEARGARRGGTFGALTTIAGALLDPRFNVWPEMYSQSEEHSRPFDLYVLTDENQEALKSMPIAIRVASNDICRRDNEMCHARLTELGAPHEYNDWNARPRLDGGGHDLRNNFNQYVREILDFHASAFMD